MGIGYASGLTAYSLTFPAYFAPDYMADHVGNVSFGDVNGAYFFLVGFGMLAFVAFIWSVCKWNNLNGGLAKIGLAAMTSLFAVTSTTFGILSTTNTVGSVSVGDVSGTSIM